MTESIQAWKPDPARIDNIRATLAEMKGDLASARGLLDLHKWFAALSSGGIALLFAASNNLSGKGVLIPATIGVALLFGSMCYSAAGVILVSGVRAKTRRRAGRCRIALDSVLRSSTAEEFERANTECRNQLYEHEEDDTRSKPLRYLVASTGFLVLAAIPFGWMMLKIIS